MYRDGSLHYTAHCCYRKTLVPRDYGAIRLFSRAGPYSLLSLSIKYGWPELAVLLLQHGYPPSKYEIYALVKIIRDTLGTNSGIYGIHAGMHGINGLNAGIYGINPSIYGINPGIYSINLGIYGRNGTLLINNPAANIIMNGSDATSTGDTINADGRRVIACYMAAGYRGQKGDERLLDNLQLPPNRSLDAASLSWTKEQVVGLVRLKQLCRVAIRSFLRERARGGSVIEGIYKLKDYLPGCMMDYLALAEFSWTWQEGAYKPIY